MFRNVYYYQTFVGLKPVLENSNAVSVLNVSSIHFGKDDSGKPYIHLNNLPPNDSTFEKLWEQTKQASDKGIKIVLMVGGEAGAYNALFPSSQSTSPLSLPLPFLSPLSTKL